MSDPAAGPDLSTWDGQIEYLIERGYADDEIAAEFDWYAQRDGRRLNYAFTRAGDLVEWTTLRGRREILALLSSIRGTARGPRTRPGPKPSTTRAAVERARAELEADGLPSGERPIADRLGVSRGAVRFALDKDRRSV